MENNCQIYIYINKDVVLGKLRKLKPDKSAGPDNVLPIIHLECCNELVTPVTLIFQASIDNSSIPTIWKEATVTAIHKKGSKTNPNNYRPISLTCVICKILESIVREQILDFLINNNKISDCQFGFMSGKSCSLQLLYVTDSWIKELNEGSRLSILYTDFKKVFDSVSHSKLLYKLQTVGISGNLLIWIKDFLSCRVQRVRVNNYYSEYEQRN